MKKLLFVNACVNRSISRTERLAHAVLSFYGDYDIETLVLEKMGLAPLGSEEIRRRSELVNRKEYDDPMFDLAKKFASADIVIFATPYWESMFDALLHIFIERIGVVGMTFRYSEEGVPIGLCKADTLYYVTTRGGQIDDEEDLGFCICRSLCRMYGIRNCIPISASALDIRENDPERILRESISTVGEKIGRQ